VTARVAARLLVKPIHRRDAIEGLIQAAGVGVLLGWPPALPMRGVGCGPPKGGRGDVDFLNVSITTGVAR